MNNIYDNGELLLGSVKDIKEYTLNNMLVYENDEENMEILDFIKDYKENDIVCINYDNGMGLSFDIWQEIDKVEKW